jgi:hypothetical protein
MIMRTTLVLAIVLAGCDADEDREPPAVAVQPEPERPAPPGAAPAGLGTELAGEVERAKVRCKGAEGIDRATDLDGDITGEWTGEYRYDEPGRDPVVMDASFTVSGGILSGRTTEPNTFAPGGLAELSATVVGDVLVGGRVTFMKTYTAGTVQHSILYIGQLDPRRRTLQGRWRSSTLTGTFELERAGLRPAISPRP